MVGGAWVERGQALILIAFFLTIMASLAAFSLDAGFAMVQQRKAEAAADAGAMAAARLIATGAGSAADTSVRDAISAYVQANGAQVSFTTDPPFYVSSAGAPISAVGVGGTINTGNQIEALHGNKTGWVRDGLIANCTGQNLSDGGGAYGIFKVFTFSAYDTGADRVTVSGFAAFKVYCGSIGNSMQGAFVSLVVPGGTLSYSAGGRHRHAEPVQRHGDLRLACALVEQDRVDLLPVRREHRKRHQSERIGLRHHRHLSGAVAPVGERPNRQDARLDDKETVRLRGGASGTSVADPHAPRLS
ncbi:MAG: hypothetical protein HY331_06055 [Chloroflexi bacterium]|nr:hypothetical protein [Chloroflexota bacterium]